MSSNIREWLYRPGVCPPLTPPLSPLSPPVSRQWFSSGSWQIDGIMNSDVLCKCGCTLLPSLALQTTQFQHQPTAVHVLSPPLPHSTPLPSTLHSTPLRPSSWSWRTDADDEELLMWVWTPALLQTPQVTLLPPLLINPSPSHSGFDATNVGGLSRFCHQRGSKGGALVKGTTPALEESVWMCFPAVTSAGRLSEQHGINEGIPAARGGAFTDTLAFIAPTNDS